MVAVGGGRQGLDAAPEAAQGGTQPAGASMLRDVLFVVFKRKVPLFTLVILGALIVAYGSIRGEPEYEALARVFVKRLPLGYQMPAESDAVLKRVEVVNSEMAIIASSAVASLVVDRLGLADGESRPAVIHAVQKKIRTDSPVESDIIDIKYRHTDPEMAAAVVNAVLDAYLETRRSVAYNLEAVEFLNTQAAVVRALLRPPPR